MKDKNKATPSATGGYTLTKKTVKKVGSPLAKKKEMPDKKKDNPANVGYEKALKANKAWATMQLKREAKQGKKGAPNQAAVNAAFAKGKDKLTTEELNEIYNKFSPPPKEPKNYKTKPKKK